MPNDWQERLCWGSLIVARDRWSCHAVTTETWPLPSFHPTCLIGFSRWCTRLFSRCSLCQGTITSFRSFNKGSSKKDVRTEGVGGMAQCGQKRARGREGSLRVRTSAMYIVRYLVAKIVIKLQAESIIDRNM